MFFKSTGLFYYYYYYYFATFGWPTLLKLDVPAYGYATPLPPPNLLKNPVVFYVKSSFSI